jgi:hypothetical protein
MSRDEFDYAFDRYDEAECADFEAAVRQRRPQLSVVPELAAVAAAEVPARAPRRCPGCGYCRGALGHRVSCLAGAA